MIARTMDAHDLKLTPPRDLNPSNAKSGTRITSRATKTFRKLESQRARPVRWKYSVICTIISRRSQSVDESVGRLLKYLRRGGAG